MTPTEIRDRITAAHETAIGAIESAKRLEQDAIAVARDEALAAVTEFEQLVETVVDHVTDMRDIPSAVPPGQTIFEAMDERPGYCFIFRPPRGKSSHHFAAWLTKQYPAYEVAVSFDGLIVMRRPDPSPYQEPARFPFAPHGVEDVRRQPQFALV